jgi:SH3-like domain-containing protein
MITLRSLFCALLVFLSIPGVALALEYRSVAADATILYDAPSSKARRLYIVNQYFPVEVVVELEGWAKVRDSTGELAWIEKARLSDKRTVVVTVPVADVRQAPQATAPLIFQAEQRVMLELLEYTGTGWLKVRHKGGQTGFVQISQVWGA